jgi:hypothetical protein
MPRDTSAWVITLCRGAVDGRTGDFAVAGQAEHREGEVAEHSYHPTSSTDRPTRGATMSNSYRR